MTSNLFSAVLAALVTAALTGLVRRMAIAGAVLDLPNERSLHRAPTPRAGGLAIAIVVLGWYSGWAGSAALPWRTVIGLIGGSTLVAVVGWIDDIRSLPSGVRAVTQVMAAAWFMTWTGGLDSLRVGEDVVAVGPIGTVLALVGIVWSINLYNFMDGIDGIAGGQAVIAAGFAGRPPRRGHAGTQPPERRARRS